METEISHKAEDYLEAIYRLQRRRGVARTTELAHELNVVPGSVTNTVQHLIKHGLVTRKPYKGIRLTTKGERVALRILRRHRLAERLLSDILGAGWSTVHDSACDLEHALTEEVTRLLDKRLGYPKSCPHGNPIPTESGRIEEDACYPLAHADMNKLYTISRITDEKKEELLFLAERGIKPGTTVRVVGKRPSGIDLLVARRRCTLNSGIASKVMIKNLEKEDHET